MACMQLNALDRKFKCSGTKQVKSGRSRKLLGSASTLLKGGIDRLLHKSRLGNRNITAIILKFIESASPLNHLGL
jgi:hypothetical protein